MKKLPIGIQDFAKLIEDDYRYVDKTEYVYRLIQTGGYQLLSRPRRFGKSLLVTTLKQAFLGRRELFAGLWIENKIDWETYPVIHVDMNAFNYRTNALEEELTNRMGAIAKEYSVQLETADYKNRFTELLQKLSKDEKRCVVLVDEYDKPITDYLEEPERAAEHVKVLKNFYGTLKSQDQHLHFVFLTGVSKYGKVSIFSDLNNLLDITMDQKFATLAGYTSEELTDYFSDYLMPIAKQRGVSEEELLDQIRFWYNGYSWDAQTSVYNPFSVLTLLQIGTFRNYWFTTGTPTFLTQQLKKEQIAAYELDNLSAVDTLLSSGDLHHVDITALLFQTGYLTVKAIREVPAVGEMYTLGFPNHEVAVSFQQYLLAEYVAAPVNKVSGSFVIPLISSLSAANWEAFFETVQSLFASLPYSLFTKQEKYFHSIMHVLLGSTGLQTFSEVQTNRGRMDTVVTTPDRVLIFEFKIDQPATAALQQIRDLEYPERFKQEGKRTVLIGVSFSTEERGVGEWVVEEG